MDLADRSVSATPEGVSLGVVLAGLGSRFVAYLIDLLLQVAAMVAVLLGLRLVVGGGTSETTSLVVGGFVACFALLDFLGYFVLFELLTGGRSPGKRATGLRVVRTDGGPIGFWASLLRNALRLIDLLPWAYLAGSVLVLATPTNQRAGDLAAGTLVIRERTGADRVLAGRSWEDPVLWSAPVGAPAWGALPGAATTATGWGGGPAVATALPAELAHWDVSAVGPGEVTVVGMFLTNRWVYAPEARQRLAVDLAGRLWPKVGGAPPTLPPEQFLESVAYVKSVRG
jgi:uncharacterized RDD family membrane protein YckC